MYINQKEYIYIYICAWGVCMRFHPLMQEPVVEIDDDICPNHSFDEPPNILQNLFHPFGFPFLKNNGL